MEKERYKVRVSDDLCFVGVFDLQENKYVVNESVICLDTAHLLCDLFNKVDKQDARIKELEEENNFLEKRNEKLIIDCRDFCLVRKKWYFWRKPTTQRTTRRNKTNWKLSSYVDVSKRKYFT